MVQCRVKVFSNNKLIPIICAKDFFYTGKSSLGAPLVEWEIEIDLFCPLIR